MEEGGASAILAIADNAGVPLAETQKELTPFQRIVVQKAAVKQQEMAKEKHSGQSPSSGQTLNSKHQPPATGNGAFQGETVKYVNEGK